MPPPKKGEHKHHHHHPLRFLPLLLLMFYASFSILKLASDHPSLSPYSLPSSQSAFVEISKEVEPLRTHITNEPRLQAHEEKRPETSVPCSSLINGGKMSRNDERALCCDRSQFRTDICYMKGDIRTETATSSVILFNSGLKQKNEYIRPYTRKWETLVMETVQGITIRPVDGISRSRCEVHHKAPAVLFSAGGYTGNVFHEFNDGMIPLYITASRFKREVVLVVMEYHSWWFTKYKSLLRRMSRYKVVDYSNDGRVHCFGEMIVGLKIHGDLTIDPRLMAQGKGIQNFQTLMGNGFSIAAQSPSPSTLLSRVAISDVNKPKIAIFVRHRSRMLYNLKEIIRTCHKIGFQVELVDPKRTTPLSDIYTVLNSSDVMLAVHGAAMTHFLFMRPSTVLIQVVPIGLDWAAETYYGEPARKLGLDYMAYNVAPEESSLTKVYGRHDPVIVDPRSVTMKGWSETKKIYLDKQNVRVNMRRFGKILEKAYSTVYKRHFMV